MFAGFGLHPLCCFIGGLNEIAKTALGAEETVPWSHQEDALELARKRCEEGVLLVALEQTGRSRPYDELKVAERTAAGGLRPVCLVVGNEVAGVAPGLLELAPVHMSLPMAGMKGSLNVAVAFGIATFEIARQMRTRGEK